MEKIIETLFTWLAVGVVFYVLSYVLYNISKSGEKLSEGRLSAIMIYGSLMLLTAGGIYVLTKERGIIASILLFIVIAVIGWVTNKKTVGQAGV
ncbi:MAG: hypothetical protein LLF78_08380 [Synergistaceae bacterium]|nr:hypothetical protein [Synergistaceae bacterium]